MKCLKHLIKTKQKNEINEEYLTKGHSKVLVVKSKVLSFILCGNDGENVHFILGKMFFRDEGETTMSHTSNTLVSKEIKNEG